MRFWMSSHETHISSLQDDASDHYCWWILNRTIILIALLKSDSVIQLKHFPHHTESSTNFKILPDIFMRKFEKCPGFTYYYKANMTPLYFATVYGHEIGKKKVKNKVRLKSNLRFHCWLLCSFSLLYFTLIFPFFLWILFLAFKNYLLFFKFFKEGMSNNTFSTCQQPSNSLQ